MPLNTVHFACISHERGAADEPHNFYAGVAPVEVMVAPTAQLLTFKIYDYCKRHWHEWCAGNAAPQEYEVDEAIALYFEKAEGVEEIERLELPL